MSGDSVVPSQLDDRKKVQFKCEKDAAGTWWLQYKVKSCGDGFDSWYQCKSQGPSYPNWDDGVEPV